MFKRKLIIDLFDGGDGAQSGGQGSESGTAAETTASGNEREATNRAKELGLDDDMVDSYKKAFFPKSGEPPEGEEKAETGSEEEAGEEDNPDEEFLSLIKGKYSKQYGASVQAAVSDRMKARDSEIAKLKADAAKNSELAELLLKKYPDATDGGVDALIAAIRNDDATWQQDAMREGIGTDEARQRYDDGKKVASLEDQIKKYKQQEQARELDRRLQGLAEEVKKVYPKFDLYKECENPDFCAALDFIASRNMAKGKDEIYDLKFAYEMAHSEELNSAMVQSTAKATMSAVAQDLAAKGRRPAENANTHAAPGKTKGIGEMSDEEFEKLVAGVRSGTAHIPR